MVIEQAVSGFPDGFCKDFAGLLVWREPWQVTPFLRCTLYPREKWYTCENKEQKNRKRETNAIALQKLCNWTQNARKR